MASKKDAAINRSRKHFLLFIYWLKKTGRTKNITTVWLAERYFESTNNHAMVVANTLIKRLRKLDILVKDGERYSGGRPVNNYYLNWDAVKAWMSNKPKLWPDIELFWELINDGSI